MLQLSQAQSIVRIDVIFTTAIELLDENYDLNRLALNDLISSILSNCGFVSNRICSDHYKIYMPVSVTYNTELFSVYIHITIPSVVENIMEEC